MPSADVAQVRLLAADPDLASGLREDDRLEATEQVIVPMLGLGPGPWAVEQQQGARRPFAFLVLSGAVLRETHLADVPALQILGPGDLVHAGATSQLQIATDARVAVLDQSLQLPFATWPGLQVALIERMAGQLDRLGVHQAIAQLPHVEQRVEALFRLLAERWGAVTPDGTLVRLALTHEVIGQLVGARRPTVTLAVRALAGREVLVRRADRTWMLVGEVVAPRARPARVTRSAVLFQETIDAPPGRRVRPQWDAAARAELIDHSRRAQRRHAEQRALVDQALKTSATLRDASRRLREDAQKARAAPG